MAAIIPMLIEALPLVTGAIVGVATCAFIFFKKKHTSDPLPLPKITPRTPQATVTPPASAQPAPAPKKPETPITPAAHSDDIVEEAMLKRHHLHHLRQMLEATTFPRPEDSVLARHYDEMIDAKAEEYLNDEGKISQI